MIFAYKDYADGGQGKTMALSLEEFTRRFLLHVPVSDASAGEQRDERTDSRSIRPEHALSDVAARTK